MDKAVEENQQFRGFNMNDVGKEASDSELNEEKKDDHSKEEKESLLNGTEEENTVVNEVSDKKVIKVEIESEEENAQNEEANATEVTETQLQSEKADSNENKKLPTQLKSGYSNYEKWLLKYPVEGSRQERTEEEEEKEERRLPEVEPEEDEDQEDDEEALSSSDGEDFLGFDVADNNEKEEFIRSLLDEHESIDSSDSGSQLKPQGKSKKSLYKIAWKKTNYDVAKPEYRKPFELGWVRELVYRSTSDSSFRRNADIYYFTPTGKKVRSFREVAEHLTDGELTIDNFTFFKEPIGIGDPDKEIIRVAKAKPPFKLNEDGFAPSPVKKLTPKLKATTAPKTPGTTTPVTPKGSPPDGSGTPKSANLMPRVVFKGSGTPKNKVPTAKPKLGIKDKKRRSAGPDDMDMLPPSWSPETKANPAREVCSIECRLAMGLIPTLQCHVCLCLYHPECVGLKDKKHFNPHNYICKSCQLVVVSLGNKTVPTSNSSGPAGPPPLTPLPSNTPTTRASSKPVTPPKQGKVVTGPRSQSIVGAVTTWLPPSSSIQVSQPSATTKTPPAPSTTTAPSDGAPQSLVSMNKKQYVVVAKHNVVNVMNQPNTAIPAVTPIQNEQNLGTVVVSAQSQSITSPPGVLLVPYTVQQGAAQPDSNQPAQYVIMNNSSGAQPNFIISHLNQPTASVPVVQSSLPQTTSTQTNGVERRSSSPVEGLSPPPEKKQKVRESQQSGNYPVTQNFMMNLNAGFLALLHAFRYLKVHELLRASCVSHMWKHIASHRTLWETIHMKNSRVRDWSGFGRALSTSGTRSLDLKKMLLPDTQEAIADMWTELSKAVAQVATLKKIDFGRCIPDAIENVAKSCPQLESITSLSIRGSQLDVSPIASCTNLVELRLKSLGGFELKNLTSLKCLKELKHLSLTTVKSLQGIEEILGDKLESLELGECSSLSETMATEALPKLTNLKRMRLEKGQGPACPTLSLLNTVSTLANLTQLELINFDVKPGFDKALAKCTNLRTLLIIPTYVTQSATTNHVVMGGVSKLSSSLTYFVWGLTLELLRVTDLFIDQVEVQKGKAPQQPQPAKKGAGDSIPILKPIVEEGSEGSKEGQTASQVDILALPKLQKVLSTLLPTTKIKILKVPFSATWRQTISETPQ